MPPNNSAHHIKLESTTSKLPPLVRNEYEQIFKQATPMIYQTLQSYDSKNMERKLRLSEQRNTNKTMVEKNSNNRYLFQKQQNSNKNLANTVEISASELPEIKFPNIELILKKSSDVRVGYNIYERCVKKNANPLK